MGTQTNLLAGHLTHRRARLAADTPSGETLPGSLDRVYEFGLCVCLFAVPLTMAGILDYGVALFVTCAFVMGLTWSVRHLISGSTGSPFSGAEVVCVLALGLVWLQFQQLHPDTLRRLSPFIAQSLPLWGSSEDRLLGQTGWHQISLTPEATRSGFVLLTAYVMFFLTLVQHLKSERDIDRTMKLVAVAAALMAVLGLAQLFFGNGKFLWLIEHSSRDTQGHTKGTFTNQNHFAQFLALGLGPLLLWWQSASGHNRGIGNRLRSADRQFGISPRERTNRRGKPEGPAYAPQKKQLSWLIAAATALVVLAGILTVSRGGIAAMFVAAVVVLCGSAKDWKRTLGIAIPLITFVLVAIFAYGTAELQEHWQQITEADSVAEIAAGRRALWSALLTAIPDFWPVGSGVGSHGDVYQIYLSMQSELRFTHAESGYLQVLLETGVTGFALLLAALGLCAGWCIRGWRRGDEYRRLRAVALSAGLLASALHSLVDFPWYLPGCLIPTLILAACACRSCQLADNTKTVPGRFPTLPTVLAALLLVSAFPTGKLIAGQLDRRVTAAPHWKAAREAMKEVIANRDVDGSQEFSELLETAIGHLQMCVTADQDHYGAWSMLAPLYLQRFETRVQTGENRMTLQQIRNTIDQSEFESTGEIRDWLALAFDDSTTDLYRAVLCARRALSGTPLRAQNYVLLAETGFLGGQSRSEKRAMTEQAVLLRPHEPVVLYAAGLVSNEDGDSETAWKLWQRAGSLSADVLQQVLNDFADLLTAQELIERLEPDHLGFWELFRWYQLHRQSERQDTVARLFAEDFPSSGPGESCRQAGTWANSGDMLSVGGHVEGAIECMQRAVQLSPERRKHRVRLAKLLMRSGRLAEARRELSWIHVRYPDDESVTAALRNVERKLSANGENR